MFFKFLENQMHPDEKKQLLDYDDMVQHTRGIAARSDNDISDLGKTCRHLRSKLLAALMREGVESTDIISRNHGPLTVQLKRVVRQTQLTTDILMKAIKELDPDELATKSAQIRANGDKLTNPVVALMREKIKTMSSEQKLDVTVSQSSAQADATGCLTRAEEQLVEALYHTQARLKDLKLKRKEALGDVPDKIKEAKESICAILERTGPVVLLEPDRFMSFELQHLSGSKPLKNEEFHQYIEDTVELLAPRRNRKDDEILGILRLPENVHRFVESFQNRLETNIHSKTEFTFVRCGVGLT